MWNRFALACVLLGLAWAPVLRAAEDGPPPRPFFDATLDDTAHRPVALEGLRGKPVLVNFWATWCTPCRAEIPALVDAYEDGKDKGLAVVGIAVDDDLAAVGKFASTHEVSYSVLTGKDQAMALMRELGNGKMVVPFTVAIDRNGKVVASKIGILRRGDLEQMLDAILSGTPVVTASPSARQRFPG